jgi:hypothetical protein
MMDRVSGRRYGTAERVPTEPRPSGFYKKIQFQYYDRLLDVSTSNQVVYKFVMNTPVEVIGRELDLYAGGREYLIYRDSPAVTFTGTLSDSGLLRNINAIGGSPSSQSTIQRAIGAGIFSCTDHPVIGVPIVVGNGGSRRNTVYTPDTLRVGLEPSTVWIVMNNLGNASTKGSFILTYEEV